MRAKAIEEMSRQEIAEELASARSSAPPLSYVLDLAESALASPKSYYGELLELTSAGYGRTISKHRDSDVLDISNYETAREMLARVESLEQALGRDEELYEIAGSNHWGVGWLDELVVRVFRPSYLERLRAAGETIEPEELGAYWRENRHELDELGLAPEYEEIETIWLVLADISASLEQYPILDEEDYSEREYEELVEHLRFYGDSAGELVEHVHELGYSRAEEIGNEEIERALALALGGDEELARLETIAEELGLDLDELLDELDELSAEHVHVWGEIELSRFAGTPHRKCQTCSTISLDLDDKEETR